MVDYKYKDLFYDRSVKKSLRIYNDDETLVLTNSDIHYESFELTESICSEQNLVFGSCEPSMVKFRVSNIVTSLKNQWLTVSETLEGGADEPFLFGRYKVFSDEITSDRKYRDITAYDALHDALEVDLTAWYNNLLPKDDSEVTQKQFRDSLFEFLGIEQEDIILPNDDMIIQRTIQPEQLFGFDVLTALCEINGCFGHIGRDGKFQYIHLKEMEEGLYPSNTLFPRDDLYPRDPVNSKLISKGYYINADYEDFITERINKLQIRQQEGDIGKIYPDTEASENDNCYIVQDNFLVYGKSSDDLEQIAANMYSVIAKVWYRPAHVEAKGNPCLEVGDGIRLRTKNKVVYTYILQRTLKGIQALRDTYDADGEQYQKEKVNDTHAQIQQLKGKTNILTRTIEETRLEIQDVEKGLSSQIIQTADSLRFEVTERTSIYNEEVNTLQGGMDGSIDLSFFSNSESAATVTTIAGKQCIISSSDDPINGSGLFQDVSLPAGTYLLSYEWLRTLGLYITADLKLLNLTSGEVIYSKFLGDAWPELDVWHKESQQFSIEKTSRIRFEFFYSAPSGYPDRVNDVHLTNIALYGTAQSVADAIADVKAEMILQSDQISLKVSKNDIISEINQTAEAITIRAERIDLDGLVEAEQFKAKWAEIESIKSNYLETKDLYAEVAKLGYVEAEDLKANAAEFGLATAAQLIAVEAMFGSLNADNITAGTMSVDRIDLNGLASKTIEVNTLIASMRITSAYMNTTTFNCNEFNGRNPSWQTITINGTSYTVLTA